MNFQRNLVAVDMAPAADPSEVLGVQRICSINFKSKVLMNDPCVVVVYKVDLDLNAADIAANIGSVVPVSCVRRGRCFNITFEGITVPAEVFLLKLCRLVRLRLPSPPQCSRCGRFGHATTCARDEHCLQASGDHPNEPCPSEHQNSGKHPPKKEKEDNHLFCSMKP